MDVSGVIGIGLGDFHDRLYTVLSGDRAIPNLKVWQHGTHRWVSPENTQAYLDEYAFRHNRRGNPMTFQTLLSLGAVHQPVPRRQIIAEGPNPRPRKYRS